MLLRINPWKRAAFIVVMILGVMGVAEFLLSARFGDSPPAERLHFNLNPLANENLYLYDPALFWRLKPGAMDEESRINKQGMRGPLIKKSRKAGILRVLLIGDSIPYGFKLDDKNTIGAHMRRLLGPKDTAEVINGGVVGYSSFQTLNYFQLDLASYKPDIVVIYVGNNDWLESPTYPDKDQPVLRESIGSAWDALRRLAIYRGMRLALLKSGLMERRYKAGHKRLRRVSRIDYAANLRAIRDISLEIGATPLYCRIVQFSGTPACLTGGYYQIPEDLTVIDTLKPFDGQCLPQARRYFQDGIHPTSEGARLIAETITKKIKEFSSLKQ